MFLMRGKRLFKSNLTFSTFIVGTGHMVLLALVLHQDWYWSYRQAVHSRNLHSSMQVEIRGSKSWRKWSSAISVLLCHSTMKISLTQDAEEKIIPFSASPLTICWPRVVRCTLGQIAWCYKEFFHLGRKQTTSSSGISNNTNAKPRKQDSSWNVTKTCTVDEKIKINFNWFDIHIWCDVDLDSDSQSDQFYHLWPPMMINSPSINI